MGFVELTLQTHDGVVAANQPVRLMSMSGMIEASMFMPDISLDGITLSTPRPLPVGTRLRVEVRIAEDRLIGEGLASVASATAREMRLQFAQLRGPLVDQLAKRENAPGLNR